MDALSGIGPVLLFGAGAGAALFAGAVVVLWASRAAVTPAAWLGPRTLRGAIAKVVVAVPANGVGRVAYSASGKRCSMAARSADAEPLPPGAEVVVVEVRRGVATVAPLH